MGVVLQPGLRAALLAFAALAALVGGVGCASEYHPEYHPETSYRYVQNVNYNNTTVVQVPPAEAVLTARVSPPRVPSWAAEPAEPRAPAPPSPAALPPPVESAKPRPPLSPPVATIPQHAIRPNLPSTGIAACDQYLARLESCSQSYLSYGTEGFANLLETLDLTRRNYRRALRGATESTRATFVDSCETGLRMYERSLNGQCQ